MERTSVGRRGPSRGVAAQERQVYLNFAGPFHGDGAPLESPNVGATKGPAKPPANGAPVVCPTEPPNQFYKPIQGTQEHPGTLVSPPRQGELLTHLTGTSLLESGRQGVAVSNYGQSLGPMDPTHVGSKPEAEYELSISVEHTTEAHKLLMWP
ncbi:hypothetical protein N7471_010784 [Penicillium samsonianum]|uniref:uncharacterized protein n=1 Tax=Penicillium samsonianum TaxID=1882272 RepID=UPI00254667FA|nr:uncharacterized protein N7471_010784 [Penicillium samsonianum]KAJ6126291.1 hypothetical protein N7471_010784 [Penicillium samsonianum]